MPDVKASVTGAMGQGKIKGNSEDEVYAIPAFGVSVPITDGLSPPDWRFGLAAFGVTGLGVDYRESNLDQPTFFPFTMAGAPADGPLITGEYTALQSMRFAPAFGFQPNAKVSFGLAGIIEYSNPDLGNGSDWDYGFGVQGGAIFRPWLNTTSRWVSAMNSPRRSPSIWGTCTPLKIRSVRRVPILLETR